jgi:16S rRNA (adenine1518-N6/adenine1519-N6)-dimethyltransferase
MTTPQPVTRSKALLDEARQLRLKKRFSQNFLVDPQAHHAIVTQVLQDASENTSNVILEIGPGAGFLTRLLLEHPYHLVAVEIDRQMCQYLRQQFKPLMPPEGEPLPSFRLIEGDFLELKPEALPEGSFTVVGNLPYHITTPILFNLIGEMDSLDHPMRKRVNGITIMVQKEVGLRLTAKPGVKAYNALSIAAQMWCEVSWVCDVPARAFFPEPKVDSCVVHLSPRAEPLIAPHLLKLMRQLVREGFAQKRKNIKNSLSASGNFPLTMLTQSFETCHIDPRDRAESLSIEQFGQLAHVIHTHASQD